MLWTQGKCPCFCLNDLQDSQNLDKYCSGIVLEMFQNSKRFISMLYEVLTLTFISILTFYFKFVW